MDSELSVLESKNNLVAEYHNLPPVPETLPPSIQEVFGIIDNCELWLTRKALKIAAKNPGWLKDFQNGEEAIAMLRDRYRRNTPNNPVRLERELKEIALLGGVSFLPAVLLRSLEVLAPDHPELANFWRGGTYRDGQSLHALSMCEFSLSSSVARNFLTTSPRPLPCIFQLPVARAVSGFREGKLSFVQETADCMSMFGYSVMISTLKDPYHSGVLAYRVR